MTEDPTFQASAISSVGKSVTFPKAAIESALQDELLVSVTMQAEMSGTTLPTDQGKLVNQQLVIDSLVAVEILCVVDDFLGFELKAERVVRAGGYNSIKEAVDHMMPRIENAWEKENKKGGTSG